MNRTLTRSAISCGALLALTACASSTTPSSDSVPTAVSVPVSSGTAGLAQTPPPATAQTRTPASTPSPSRSANPGVATATWYKDVGKADIATLTTDINSVSSDDAHHDSTDLQLDCVQLDNDWQTIHSDPAVPDTQAQQSWSAALATIRQGWWDCNGGFSDNSTTAVGNAVAEIESAGPLLTATTRRIEAVG